MSLTEAVLDVVSDGIRLGCSCVHGERPRGVVVLLHGLPSVNPPDPEDRGYPGFAADMAEAGWLAVWADMRAVRRTAGTFSIEGWVRDARAVVDQVRSLEAAGDLPLALVGSSAGGAVSAEVVRRGAPVDALALLGAPAAWLLFTRDPKEGLRRITEEAGMPVAPEVSEDPSSWASEFDSVSTATSIKQVTIPTLILHGTADDVVPVKHAHLIAEAAPAAELVVLEGAGHILRRDAEARRILLEWLARTLR